MTFPVPNKSVSCSLTALVNILAPVDRFSTIPTSSCNSLTASTKLVESTIITSLALAPVINSIKVPCAISTSAFDDILPATTLFSASVCGIPKFWPVFNVPVNDLNLSVVESADKRVPENPPDWVNTAFSTNSAGIVGEPVNVTFKV